MTSCYGIMYRFVYSPIWHAVGKHCEEHNLYNVEPFHNPHAKRMRSLNDVYGYVGRPKEAVVHELLTLADGILDEGKV